MYKKRINLMHAIVVEHGMRLSLLCTCLGGGEKIDPWTTGGQTCDWDQKYANFGPFPMAVVKKKVEVRVARCPDTDAILNEGTYPACADQVWERIDSACLDLSRDYERTIQELKRLDNRIAPGGVIIGDDWEAVNDPPQGASKAADGAPTR